MEWIPVVFIAFKLLVFGTGMFFAIKWHHDRRKEREEELARRDATNSTSPKG